MIRFDHHPKFITITNLNWLPLLENSYHKQIIIESLIQRTRTEQVTVYGFVIMPNHMHLIWQLHDNIIEKDFLRDFLKFTARSILGFMKMNNNNLLDLLYVNAADRKFQVWERNSLAFEIHSEKVLLQKLGYIHLNPLQPKWKLADNPLDYKFSSAAFYETGKDEFGFLTHYQD